MKIVIRAGGSGTRLWPLSRQKAPKQFLPFLGGTSLFVQKVAALRPLIKHREDLYVSVGARFAATVRRLVPWILESHIIAEPEARNTGPAIGLESVIIRAHVGKDEDPVIATVTVDDVFRNQEKFLHALASAERYVLSHPFAAVTIASKTTVPDEGLSYIVIGKKVAQVRRQPLYLAKRWIEKPTGARLTRLHHNPRVYAHTGLYVWRTSTILASFASSQPLLYRRLLEIERRVGKKDFPKKLRTIYGTLPKMSIEEAITRFLDRVVVVAGEYGWSDTGKWYLVYEIGAKDADGNVRQGHIVLHDTKRSLLWGHGKRLLATIGLRDMVIVDTPDALLVAAKGRSAEVRMIVEALRDHGLDAYR